MGDERGDECASAAGREERRGCEAGKFRLIEGVAFRSQRGAACHAGTPRNE